MEKNELEQQNIAALQKPSKAKCKRTRKYRSFSTKSSFACFCQMLLRFPLVVQVLVMLIVIVLLTNPTAMAGLVNLIHSLRS